MERRLGLAFTTLTILAPRAHASPPPQAVRPEGTAALLEFVATAPAPALDPDPVRPGPPARSSPGPARRLDGLRFARQVLPAAATPGVRAQSRVIYLNHDDVVLRPGTNDASRQVSSIVEEPTAIAGWPIDDDAWAATVACVADLYAAFDVQVTDRDPGAVPHIEAVFGGHPRDVGLPDNVAGVAPFTTDCAIIENAIVFTFTDVLPDDPQTVCEVAAQEIAHAFGLDHELLAADPMTYLPYDGDRSFQDQMATCGEQTGRPCGINGATCRARQNSVQLLTQRLGARGASAGGAGGTAQDGDPGASAGGCAAGGGPPGAARGLAPGRVQHRRRLRGAGGPGRAGRARLSRGVAGHEAAASSRTRSTTPRERHSRSRP